MIPSFKHTIYYQQECKIRPEENQKSDILFLKVYKNEMIKNNSMVGYP
jgi:hypothetical protein